MPEHTGSLRPGGRTAQTRRAVHDAVRQLQQESDVELTIPLVAARAHVHATTVYRRWRTIESLVLDVAVEDLGRTTPVPHTGNLEKDLRVYVPKLLDDLQRVGYPRFFARLLSAQRAGAPGVAAALVEPRLKQYQEMLDAAGVTKIDAKSVIELIIAPAFFWAQLNMPLDPKRDAERLIQAVVQQARSDPGEV